MVNIVCYSAGFNGGWARGRPHMRAEPALSMGYESAALEPQAVKERSPGFRYAPPWAEFSNPPRRVNPTGPGLTSLTASRYSLKIQFLRNSVALDPFAQCSPSHAEKLGRFDLISFGPFHRKHRELTLQPWKQL
jgi:hypothetical protein